MLLNALAEGVNWKTEKNESIKFIGCFEFGLDENLCHLASSVFLRVVVYFYLRFSFTSHRIKRNEMSLPAGFSPCPGIGAPWRRGSILPEMRFPACAPSTHFEFIESFFLLLRSHTTVCCHTFMRNWEPSFISWSSFRLFWQNAQSVQKSCANICKSRTSKKKTLSHYLCLPTFVRIWTFFFNALWSMTLAKWKLTCSRECAAKAAIVVQL